MFDKSWWNQRAYHQIFKYVLSTSPYIIIFYIFLLIIHSTPRHCATGQLVISVSVASLEARRPRRSVAHSPFSASMPTRIATLAAMLRAAAGTYGCGWGWLGMAGDGMSFVGFDGDFWDEWWIDESILDEVWKPKGLDHDCSNDGCVVNWVIRVKGEDFTLQLINVWTHWPHWVSGNRNGQNHGGNHDFTINHTRTRQCDILDVTSG